MSTIVANMKCLQQERYNELIEAEMILLSFYGAGVDNWDGWDIAMELLEEMEKMYIPLDIGEE